MKPLKSTDGLFITRKRKKWKFAHFDSYANCFSLRRGEDPKALKQQLTKYFIKKQPIILELAAGDASFSLELARLHPELNFIAIDIKSDRLYTSAKKALQDKVTNIAFIRTHINELSSIFKKRSVDAIWLTFPDPFPKDRSAKHRLTHSTFLKQYQTILKKDGQLKFKTDNRNLFLWSLEQFVAEKWRLQELTFDLHESNLLQDYKIKTTYEKRFLKQGLSTNFCTLTSD